MRLSTRLLLLLSAGVVVVMFVYTSVAEHQRERLLSGVHAHETTSLGRTIQVVASQALQGGRVAELERVLRTLGEDPETLAAVVLDDERNVVAGAGVADVACLADAVAAASPAGGPLAGWADCDGPTRWIVLPVSAPGARLLLARHGGMITSEVLAARRRHVLLAGALTIMMTLIILIVLRRQLVRPLAALTDGVRRLGAERPPYATRLARAPGELSELADSFNEMADRLAESYAALTRSTEERLALARELSRQERLAALGRLSGGLAHELGTPLNVIRMHAEALAAGLDDPSAREHPREILLQVERVSRLMRALLHGTRRADAPLQRASVRRLLEQVAASLRKDADAYGVRLSVRVSAPDLTVDGDPTLLEHALANLAMNGLQAMRDVPGERALRLHASAAADGTVCVVVEDRGPGLDDEQRVRAFEPFYTTKDVGEGTGLGLPISRGIVEQHGGELVLEPAPGGGVRAIVRLPPGRPAETDEGGAA